MGKRKKEEKEEEQAAEAAAAWACFPSDLLPEVLSRVPYRSLCRFKCVSMAWLALCSDPAVQKRSPQTLSGFFYQSPSGNDIRFLNLSGRGQPMVDPSLRSLHGYRYVVLLDCCGGILLCSGWDRTIEHRVYLVCNPATQEIWAALPVPDSQNPGARLVYGDCITCLCFDPAFPGRFAVFVLTRAHSHADEVEVYSSVTGEWTSMVSGWGPGIQFFDVEPIHFFLNGTLHFAAYYSGEGNTCVKQLIATVDTEASNWRTIRMQPKVWFSLIGQCQGRLHGLQVDHDDYCRISVWVLEDYATGQWTLKHTASVSELLGGHWRKPGEFYRLVAIHPERNVIFLIGGVIPEETLMSYDMDNEKLNLICTLEECDTQRFRPYIPCFAEQPSIAQ